MTYVYAGSEGSTTTIIFSKTMITNFNVSSGNNDFWSKFPQNVNTIRLQLS
jgi:hypothetical protein